jgi:hypothetical protein
MILFMTWGFLFLGLIPAFLIWRRWFNKDPFERNPSFFLAWFKKKSPLESRLESAKKNLSQGYIDVAEKEFRYLLLDLPGEVTVHLGLAECLFDKSIKGVRKDLGKREEALLHFKWALDFYSRAGEFGETLALYRKLLGPYSETELGIKRPE